MNINFVLAFSWLVILWELRGLHRTSLVIFNQNKNIFDHENILARVVVMNGNVADNQYHPLVMTSATSGSVMVEVPDGDNQVLLVVSAVPEYFKSHQTYGYQARIIRGIIKKILKYHNNWIIPKACVFSHF